MFEIRVKLTKEIYGKVSAAIFFRRFLYAYVIIALVAAVLAAALLLNPPESLNFKDFLLPALFVLFFVGFPILQSRFGYGWKSYPTAAQPATYELSETGLKVEGENYHAFQAWENFVGVRQFRVAVVLFFTRNQVFIFPNDSFANAQQREEMVAFVQSHIPAGKQRQMKLHGMKRIATIAGIWLAVIIGVFLVLTLFKK